MAVAAWILVALSVITGVFVTSASSTSGDYFTQISPPGQDGERPRGLIRCAAICARDSGCVAFSSKSGSCTTITNPALVSTAGGVVYQRTSDMTTAITSSAGPTPHWGGQGSYECYSLTKQIAYMGTESTTEHGFTCDAWTDSYFVKIGALHDTGFPEGSAEAASTYCRSVLAHYEIPMCARGEVLELCSVPLC